MKTRRLTRSMTTLHRNTLPIPDELVFEIYSRLPLNSIGLLMSEGLCCAVGGSKSFELWVLRDAAKHEWSVHVYVLPTLWKDVVTETMCIAGMVGTKEIVLSPCNQKVHSYVIYYSVESKTITKVGVRGTEDFQGGDVHICLNYVENVKLL